MTEFTIGIAPNGTISAIYNDELVDFLQEGKSTTTRASHVEPDENGQWVADLTPVGGPMLGPYALRRTALDKEVEWLEENVIAGPSTATTCRHCNTCANVTDGVCKSCASIPAFQE